MKISLWHVFGIIFAVTALQIFAVLSGHYDSDFIFFDKIEHILAGASLSLLFIWILQKAEWTGSLPLIAISIALFPLLGSFVWELFEYFVSENFSDVSNTLKLYSPDLGDALQDMFSGFIGGVITALIYFYNTKRIDN